LKLRLSTNCLGLLLGVLTSGAALASTVGGGSFSASGSFYWSITAFDFGTSSLPPPGNQMAIVSLPTTGAFSYLTFGTSIGMANLNLAAATVTPTDIDFDDAIPVFVALPPDSTGTAIDLSLTDIPIDTAVPICASLSNPDALGSQCRPYATSPVILDQGASSVTLKLVMLGDAYYAGTIPSDGTPYSAKFSSDFTGAEGTITDFLVSFDAAGSVTNAYSATFTSVPEPGALLVTALGLLGIGLIGWKKRAGQN
jgi:hypothetical protein